MRWQAALLALVAGCADWGRPPLTAPYRAGEPLIQEQGLVGIASDESAAAVQLVDAEGAPPRLDLIALDAGGGATRQIAVAPEKTARAVALRLRADGRKAVSLLAAIATEEWPEALARAAGEGFVRVPPAATRSGAREWFVPAAAHGTAAPPLLLRVAVSKGNPAAFVVLLSAPAESGGSAAEVELARQPISGTSIEAELWKTAGTVWLLSGSVADGEPLRRAIGLRRGSLRRGEAELHNGRGLSLRAARDFGGAAREFERAIAADPRFVGALYNAASTAALSGRDEEAVAFLRRAAEVDRRRVQVLGRDDEALAALRQRSDVREILGMKRPPPGTSK